MFIWPTVTVPIAVVYFHVQEGKYSYFFPHMINYYSFDFLITQDLVQPKTSPFSTRSLIWVHYKVMNYFSLPIFSLFSHLNIAPQNLAIGLCSALRIILFFNKYLANLRTVLWLLYYWLFSRIKFSFLLLKRALSILAKYIIFLK